MSKTFGIPCILTILKIFSNHKKPEQNYKNRVHNLFSKTFRWFEQIDGKKVDYVFTVFMHKQIPESWEKVEMAGENKFKGFRRPGARMNSRKPEPKCIARAMAFN